MNTHMALLLCLTSAAFITDLKTGKIPNLLCAAGLAAVLITGRTCMSGLVPGDTAALHLLGAAVPLAGGWLLYRFRMTGAGDVKFLTVIGALLGYPAIMRYLFLLLLCAAAISGLLLVFSCGVRERLLTFFAYVRELQDTGVRIPYRDPVRTAGAEFHLTVAMLMASLLMVGGSL